jgi:hypothetical protein
VWVPIIVALLGLAGVTTTQVLASRREAARVREETAREARHWQQERETRANEARASAYAQLIGVIEAYDMTVYEPLRARLKGRDLDPVDLVELRQALNNFRESFGPAVLHAPEQIRQLIRNASTPRLRIAATLLAPGKDIDANSEWHASQRGYRVLRAQMRTDLGLDAETVEDIDHARRHQHN